MPKISELGAKLLIDAAAFFRSLGEQNPALAEQMEENATVFEQMGALLNNDPLGKLGDAKHHELAGKLLGDAGTFFHTLAEQNDAIKEQMHENASVYEQIADLLHKRPNDTIGEGGDDPVIQIKKENGKSLNKALSDIFGDKK